MDTVTRLLYAMSYFLCFGQVLWEIVAPQVDQTSWGWRRGREDLHLCTADTLISVHGGAMTVLPLNPGVEAPAAELLLLLLLKGWGGGTISSGPILVLVD